MSTVLNRGNIVDARLMLDDEWTAGRRPPVKFAPISWTEDPYADPYWRFDFYSLRPTTHLLYAYYETGDTQYRDKLSDVLRSFLAVGVHSKYLTTDVDLHAAAWREMVLVNTYVKLRRSGDLPPDLAQGLRAAIRNEATFLAQPENYESNFNHGVNQVAALLLVAENFPDWPEAAAWGSTARRRLDDLADNVVDADGVEVENSPYYHYYVLNTFYQIETWAESNHVVLSPVLAATVRRMTTYAAAVTKPNGYIPLVGASMDLDAADYSPSTLDALGALNPTLAYVRSDGTQGVPPPRTSLFPASGTAILRSMLDSTSSAPSSQAWVLFDIGAWRTLHSHLDAMNVVLYANGRTLLPDAGLYQYAPAEDHTYYDHDWFYSTAAHNTIVVDGESQSRIGAVGAGLQASGPDWAYQSGWNELNPGVRQRRAVTLLGANALLVVDELDGQATHTFTQTWHLPPDLTLSTVGLDAYAADATGSRVLSIRQAMTDGITLNSTADQTLASWYSDTYGVKVPNGAVAYTKMGQRQTFVTLITAGAARTAGSVVAAEDEHGAIISTICVAGHATRVVLNHIASDGESVDVDPAGSCRVSPAPLQIQLTAPAPTAAASGTTTLEAAVSGSSDVARVDFLVDGKVIGSSASAPYRVSWKSKTVRDGSAVAIAARAVRDDGSTITSPARAVVVSNPTTHARTIVSLTFDDGIDNAFAAMPILAAHRMNASFYVITGRLGTSGYLTWDQVRALAQTGNEIGAHSVNHLDLRLLSADEVVREVCRSRATLLTHGIPVTTFAFPFDGYDPVAMRAVDTCGYGGGRISSGIGVSGEPVAELIPPADKMRVRTIGSLSALTTLSNLEHAVRAAEAQGGWVTFVLHNLCHAECRSNAVDPGLFSQFLDWLGARASSGTLVRTVGQVVGGPLRPVPTLAEPSPPGTAKNLLANPDFRRASDDIPYCWSIRTPQKATQAMQATWKLVAGGSSSERAETLAISSTRGGGQLRFESRRDSGECSPTPDSGHEYEVSLAYRGDAGTTLRVFYADEDGTWRELAMKELASSTTRVSAQLVTPPVPAGATGLSVQLASSKVGEITVDHVALRDTTP